MTLDMYIAGNKRGARRVIHHTTTDIRSGNIPCTGAAISTRAMPAVIAHRVAATRWGACGSWFGRPGPHSR